MVALPICARKPDNILPIVSISFAPVGLTLDQTARLNLVNMNVANGITVSWRFMDAQVPYLLNPQLHWESAKSFLSISSGTRCQESLPYSSELRCKFKWTSSPMESRATAFAGAWKYSIITLVKPRCTWVVEARKHSEAWKIRRHGLTKSPNGQNNERKKDTKRRGRMQRPCWAAIPRYAQCFACAK